MTLENFHAANAKRDEHCVAWNSFWTQQSLDLIMMPTMPHPATPHDSVKTMNYTCIWNYLDLPAAVLPVGVVDEQESDREVEYWTGSSVEKCKSHSSRARFTSFADTHGIDKPKLFKNAPLAIQLIGARQEDEAFAVMAEQVDAILRAQISQ